MSWFHRWFGLRTEEDTLLTLKLRLTRWRHFLKAEESCLKGLADIRGKMSGEYLFDRQYILSSADRIFQEAYQVAYDMGILCNQEEVGMYSWLDKMKEKVTAYLNNWPMVREGPFVVPLFGKDLLGSDQVGEMASHLLEIMRKGSIDMPPGFVITIQGFLHLLSFNNLEHYLKQDPSLKAIDWMERYQSLSKSLLEAAIPAELQTGVAEAMRSLGENREHSPSFTLWPSPIRSQAISHFPFPPMVWGGQCLDTFCDILRSLWSQFYRNYRLEETFFPSRYPLLTAVVCQRQISGGETCRVWTVDPIHPEDRQMVVNHLVNSAVSGSIELKKSTEYRISRTSQEELDSSSDQENNRWPPEERQKLVKLSLRIEKHFKRAQEILWEKGPDGHFYLMQLRCQNTNNDSRAALGLPLVLKRWSRYYGGQGNIVSRGITSGPAVQLKPGQDLPIFPEGAIVVAPDWSPAWNKILPKISAILLEHTPSPFLTFLARWYRIPLICQLPQVSETIPDGTVITVDAEDNSVYQGEVETLLYSQLWSGPRLEDEPEYLLLDGLLRALDHSYTSEEMETPPERLEGARTLLQGIQWVHARVMASLFNPSTWQYLFPNRLFLPGTDSEFTIYVADLGGGLTHSGASAGPRDAIQPKEITSIPWLALCRHMARFPFSREPFPAEKPPLYLMVTEDTLFLAKPSGATKFVLDTALTGIPQSNYFFWHREEGEPTHPAVPSSCWKKGTLEEIRIFGQSASLLEEQLKLVAQKLNLPFGHQAWQEEGPNGRQIADSYPRR